MTTEKLQDPNYDPNKMLDAVMERIGARNDAHLSRLTKIAPPTISKLRHRRLYAGDSVLIRLHDASELSARELRTLMGVKTEVQPAIRATVTQAAQ